MAPPSMAKLLMHVCRKCGRAAHWEWLDVTPKQRDESFGSIPSFFVLVIRCKCGWLKIYPKR